MTISGYDCWNRKGLSWRLHSVRLHPCLSSACRTASGGVHPYQSVMSSRHLLAGLPPGRSPSNIPSITHCFSLGILCVRTVSTSSALLGQLWCIVFLLFSGTFIGDDVFPTHLQCSPVAQQENSISTDKQITNNQIRHTLKTKFKRRSKLM